MKRDMADVMRKASVLCMLCTLRCQQGAGRVGRRKRVELCAWAPPVSWHGPTPEWLSGVFTTLHNITFTAAPAPPPPTTDLLGRRLRQGDHELCRLGGAFRWPGAV